MSLMDLITSQIGGSNLSQMSEQLGQDKSTTQSAIAAALPVLITALQRNASNPQGAESLSNALSRDHDGSILGNLGGLFSEPNAGHGDGILRHVLGEKRGAVERSVSRSSGLGAGDVSKLLTMLAPILMGVLGQQKRQNNMGTTDIADMLGQQTRQLEQQKPGAGGLIGGLLDQDGDGDFDLGDVAKGVLGSLFK